MEAWGCCPGELFFFCFSKKNSLQNCVVHCYIFSKKKNPIIAYKHRRIQDIIQENEQVWNRKLKRKVRDTRLPHRSASLTSLAGREVMIDRSEPSTCLYLPLSLGKESGIMQQTWNNTTRCLHYLSPAPSAYLNWCDVDHHSKWLFIHLSICKIWMIRCKCMHVYDWTINVIIKQALSCSILLKRLRHPIDRAEWLRIQ